MSLKKYKASYARKKRLSFLQNVAKLSAMKLTECGSPTLPNTGYAEIARRIRALRPDITGGVKDVLAAFVDQKEEAKRLERVFTKAKQARVQAKVSQGSYAAFYETEAWRRVRYEALRRHGGMCCLCGATAHQGAVLHVDHIKPRSLFPQLELDVDNLQVLCADCNLGKSNLDDTDWRDPLDVEVAKVMRHFDLSLKALRFGLSSVERGEWKRLEDEIGDKAAPREVMAVGREIRDSVDVWLMADGGTLEVSSDEEDYSVSDRNRDFLSWRLRRNGEGSGSEKWKTIEQRCIRSALQRLQRQKDTREAFKFFAEQLESWMAEEIGKSMTKEAHDAVR